MYQENSEDQTKNIRANYVFISYIFLSKPRFEAEVYKLKGFTVNLFINKGFDLLKPAILGGWRGGFLVAKTGGSSIPFCGQ
jgi:hypothetical protein